MNCPRTSTEYSSSVYTGNERQASPDRPGTPSSFEYNLTLQGGRSSATEMLPSNIQQTKKERLTESKEYLRAVFDASSLRAENTWLHRIRKSAITLQEGTVDPTVECLAQGTAQIHGALTQFYIAFFAVEQTLRLLNEPAVADVEATLRELTSAFEAYREGLEKVRRAGTDLENGQMLFSNQLFHTNQSFEQFFKIDDDEMSQLLL
ncbi:uncharacterized protein KD926_008961 [Aspergillus affinis]|uniref:uncharacterized protein n=1 Tax=Aspergillus affinis TaxID=1070780 RepID=UPI0022FF0A16|nr:uncharacterized protein KD926_008961 [Aspergillus affinis]KAI9039860.1 hypothetical protein KD926_008961 [Aspergillus affinis]